MMTYTECAGRRELSRIIDARTSEIATRWLDRVSADLAHTPTVQLTALRDGIRNYLAAVAQLLATSGNGLEDTSAATWARVARDHGVLHVRVGFDIDQLIHEFVTLR